MKRRKKRLSKKKFNLEKWGNKARNREKRYVRKISKKKSLKNTERKEIPEEEKR